MDDIGHLPEDLSLAEFWCRHIRFDPEVVQLFDDASEELCALGYRVPKVVPYGRVLVRYESWSSGRYRWVMGRPRPRDRIYRFGTCSRVLKVGAEVDELASDKIRNAVNQLRSGAWTASGSNDPPNGNFERADIKRETWIQPDVFIDFSKNKLCQLDGKEVVNWLRAVRIRMQPNINLAEPILQERPGPKSRKSDVLQVLDDLHATGELTPGQPRKETHKRILARLKFTPGSPLPRGFDFKTISSHIRDWEKIVNSKA